MQTPLAEQKRAAAEDLVRTGKIDLTADPGQVSAKAQGNLSLYSDVRPAMHACKYALHTQGMRGLWLGCAQGGVGIGGCSCVLVGCLNV
jgi:hypothetical protein